MCSQIQDLGRPAVRVIIRTTALPDAHGSANVSTGWRIGGGKGAVLKEGRWVNSAMPSHIAQLSAAGRAAATSAGVHKTSALGDT